MPTSAMIAIEAYGLTKHYRVYQKGEGLWASLRGLLRRRYRLIEAVCGIDLQVERGEFVAFLGPNGAGKTTTLKLLTGIITPTAGTARVLGHIPWRRENAYRRRFALVMGQKNQLWWDLPAADSFRLHQQIYGIERKQFERTRDELTALLGVRELLDRPVRELSLGERMKLELVAALLHRPEVLFLDEPTIGLDVVAQYNIQQFLKYYQEENRTTVILTSHYMKDVAALCRRVVVIVAGRIVYDGSLSGIVDRFSRYKVVTVVLGNGQPVPSLARFGELVSSQAPRVKIRVPRPQVTETIASILREHAVQDLSVEDPPLEEVIVEVFSQAACPQSTTRGEAPAENPATA